MTLDQLMKMMYKFMLWVVLGRLDYSFGCW